MRRITRYVIGLVLAGAGLALPVQAQDFRGSGQQATPLFPLTAGLAVFELEHAGSGRFVVLLLDETGERVSELVDAAGPFRGSKAVRVPQAGRYLFDVSAAGAWSVRLRDGGTGVSTAAASGEATGSPAFRSGEEAGRSAAEEISSAGWLARGLVGGVLAGPIGAAVAVGWAGNSDVDLPDDPLVNGDLAYRQGFESAFTAQLRNTRKKRAFMGGMVGSGVFLAGLIYVLDIAGTGGGSGTSSPPGPGTSFSTAPR